MIDLATDPRNWGPAKTMALAIANRGIANYRPERPG